MPYVRSCGALGLVLLLAATGCAPATAASGARPPASAAQGGGAGAPTLPVAGAAPAPAVAGSAAVDPLPLPAPIVPVAGAAAAAGGGAQAGAGGAAADCGAIRQKAEGKPGPVDIVWIIDGSGSMLDEQMAVKQNIASFATAIGGAGIDHHVVMVADTDVAAGTALGGDSAHYRYVRANVGSHDALERLLGAYSEYASFLRPAASLHFVVVTDDESRMKASEFQTQMRTAAGKSFSFHAIVSESVNGRACVGACGISLLCGAASPGLEYLALADATSGQKISICVSDWSMVFGPLKTAVIASAPLPCEYALPAPPAGASLDPLRVNVGLLLGSGAAKTLPHARNLEACASAEAWFYDDPSSPSMIRMCPAACSSISAGGAIEITLGCETVSLN